MVKKPKKVFYSRFLPVELAVLPLFLWFLLNRLRIQFQVKLASSIQFLKQFLFWGEVLINTQ